ncbi:GIN domain-containing protein [Flavobacterium granuli]|uniref:Putative auto-transporter adhesin head GIN domain-containing protein n=1 Tax=Flavobacterium granuli TaxID=280093 RepID=A0ABU1RYH7_9FLAO|nr:DUF2807 domain-containing protein [Flavobacterium granuli]MDR6843817.1 hypothetical protein [Flavobacterium granuli]
MKYSFLVVLFLLTTTMTIGQNKEKIKGSKIVVEKSKEIGDFTALEIEDNLTIFLEKGTKNEIKIDADDNLHDNISFDIKEKTLRIYTSKEISSFKKLVVKIIYTNDLKSIIAKNVTIVNALEAVMLDDITFSSLDFAKLYLNVNSKNFTLISDDKSKIELNLKADKAKIQLSKNTQIKALVTTTDIEFDLDQKATAIIEGDATNAVIRQDNNSVFTGFNFTIKNADVTAESSAICNLMADTSLIVDADNTSKIYLLGTPKIEVRKFLGEAQLIKKPK